MIDQNLFFIIVRLRKFHLPSLLVTGQMLIFRIVMINLRKYMSSFSLM
jgi:hypothetical protein